MGPPESRTRRRKNQAPGRRKRRARRPRPRCCLLKECEQKVQPRQARQRYCSESCREKAREWGRWKAQLRYRATKAGRKKRNGQSRRYRERVKTRKPEEPEPVSGAARVITQEHFFSSTPATGRDATRDLHIGVEVPCSVFVARGADALWSGCGNESGAGNRRAFKSGHIDRQSYSLLHSACRCNWSFTNSSCAGTICACATQRDSGGC
jgi:hypothetical protein